MKNTESDADNLNITISALMLKHVLSGAARQGIDIATLFSLCNLPDPNKLAPNTRVPVTSAVELTYHCASRMRDEFLGLVAQRIPLGYFRQSVLATVHQPTLGDAIARYMEFNNVFFNSLKFGFERKGKIAEVTFVREPNRQVTDNVAIECTMTVFHRMAGWLCNELLLLNNVELDYPAQPYSKEYHYLFYGAPIRFNGSINRLTFDAYYLDLPVLQNEATAESYIRRAPMDIFLPQDVNGDISRAIRKSLQISLKDNQHAIGLQDIAQDLGITTQTVRRHLAKEGTSFNTLKSQVRRDFAMNALGNPALSIEDVAIKTGYSEPASFIRAFRSWTGLTPSKFRQGLY